MKWMLVALLLPIAAAAQSWPQKPIKLIVPFPPGGVTDSLARITADWLTQRLGQPVVPDNRPGASGAIAADLVARAEPDGYTILAAATPQLAIVPHVQKITYDPIKDFAPISIVGTNAFALGSRGVGSVGHLTRALFLARAGLQMEAVLYKGGGPAMTDVIAGHVNCYFGNFNEILPHAASGRVHVLATSGEKRARQLPDVPTVAEQGYPGFHTGTWNGYVAPGGTPREIVERMAREIAAGCKDAAFTARLDKIGVDAVCGTPAEFAQAIRDDLRLWKDAVVAAGMKAP